MATMEDRQLAKKAVELGFATREQVDETLRILRLRGDIGESQTMDRLLFERKILDAGQVYEIQARTGLRPVVCPACPAHFNTFLQKPGSTTSCPRCGHLVVVAGSDSRDPFKTRPLVKGMRGGHASRAESFWGFLGLLGVGALLGKAVQESWFTEMALWILGATVVFALVSFASLRRRRLLVGASLGLALLTAVVASSALSFGPETAAFSTFGLSAHQLLPPLILFHLVALIVVGSSALVKQGSSAILLVFLLPALYGLAFFTWRSFPHTDPSHYLSGGPLLPASLPWFLHPGVITLLFLFPLAALGLLLSSVFRLRMERFARQSSLAVSLAALSCLGVAVGTARGEIPSPQLEHEVQTLLAGRLSSYWTEPGVPGATAEPAHATTAAALAVEPQPLTTDGETEMVSSSPSAEPNDKDDRH